ncbi:MAG: alanine-phosphoribitol ligase [Hyphomicrobiales bacterium]|nr:MAG: alanine-phosphoribitol ligase [Hyphomicrobiales bacterium]
MYDYIIVGGGSAGCALASRLSEDEAVRVLLLEAGPRDWHPYIHLPVCYYKTTKGGLTWGFELEPQTHQEGITPAFAQARVLGGGSSINAQVYIRGSAADYDNWVTMGCPGWSYEEVLPYFRRSEANESLSAPYHGTEGPLSVSDQRHTHPLTKAFTRACQEFGMPFNGDFNGKDQAGAGLYQITNRNGRRCSAAVAYLARARKRSNLTVRTACAVRRIVIERGRAVGVEYLDGGRGVTERADQAVILSAGAINSPKILMLSGIGPADHLTSHGIKPAFDLPGVGKNLHDHLDIFMMYNVHGLSTYDRYKKMHWQLVAGLQYALFRNGPVSANVVEGGAFWSTSGHLDTPNLQYHFLAGTGIEKVTSGTSTGNGCTLNAYLLHPLSRGQVTLRSADPAAAPSIDPKFLDVQSDLDCTIEAVMIGQEIMAQPSIAKFISNEFLPGPELRSRAGYEAFVRSQARSGYHPVGTCRMGLDEMAVVDPELRVRGIEGLRVADASIMPRLVSGNTNAPSMMIGEKAADLLRGNHIASPSSVVPFERAKNDPSAVHH